MSQEVLATACLLWNEVNRLLQTELTLIANTTFLLALLVCIVVSTVS